MLGKCFLMFSHNSSCHNSGSFPLLLFLGVMAARIFSLESQLYTHKGFQRVYSPIPQLSSLEGHSPWALTSPKVLFSAPLYLLLSFTDTVESGTPGGMGSTEFEKDQLSLRSGL